MSRKKDKRRGNLVITEHYLVEIILDPDCFYVLSIDKHSFEFTDSYPELRDSLVKITK
jgi:hypothetical protein